MSPSIKPDREDGTSVGLLGESCVAMDAFALIFTSLTSYLCCFGGPAAKQGKKSKKRSRDKYQGDKGYGAGEGPCSDAPSSFALLLFQP